MWSSTDSVQGLMGCGIDLIAYARVCVCVCMYLRTYACMSVKCMSAFCIK
jgi:hypothetical protein